MSALPRVAIELHDVAPATWPRCERLLDILDAAGARNVTLLVVPFYHRGVAIDDMPAFVDAIDARLARGDEAAVHGYVHLDEAPPPRGARDFVRRRLLTRAEGEFAVIDGDDARARIGAALERWRRVGWPVSGFVPPAWLLSGDARAALGCERSLRYVCMRSAIEDPRTGRRVASDVVTYSPTSAPRRCMSRALIALVERRAVPQRMVRLALHPQDADVPGVVRHWREIVVRALGERMPVTLSAAAQELLHDAQPALHAVTTPAS